MRGLDGKSGTHALDIDGPTTKRGRTGTLMDFRLQAGSANGNWWYSCTAVVELMMVTFTGTRDNHTMNSNFFFTTCPNYFFPRGKFGSLSPRKESQL